MVDPKQLKSEIPRIPPLLYANAFLKLILGKDLRQILRDLVKRIGPIFQISVDRQRYILVGDLEGAKELAEPKRFDKSLLGVVKSLREFGGDGLFTAATDMPAWKKAHEILLPGFTQQAMGNYHLQMLEVIHNMLAKLRNLGPQTAINISEYMYRLTSDIIFLCAFNYKPNSFSKDEANELTQIISHVFHDITTTFLIPKFIKKNMFMMHQRHKKSLKYLDNYVNQVLQERISNPEKNTNTKDLLNLMLQNKDRFGQTLDMQNIHEQIITFLVAGSHTSDILLSSAVYYLGRHPQILAKAYEEIDSVYGPEQVLKPSLVQLSKLGYISRILDECLRLHPPVPLIHYYAREDTVFLGKYTVKKEDVIFLSLDNLHREPSVWGDNADSFDPDRFLPEYVAKRDPNTYKPFGSGLRACIGKQFAQQESILTLSMLLHRYKIHLNDKTTDPEHVFVTVEQRTDDERRINSGNTATNL